MKILIQKRGVVDFNQQIFDMVFNLNRSIRPILFTHLRKKNVLSLEKNNGFIAGSYHMPMLVGKKIDSKGQ